MEELKQLLDEWDQILEHDLITERQYKRWVTLAAAAYKALNEVGSFHYIAKTPARVGLKNTRVYNDCIAEDIEKIRVEIEAKERFSNTRSKGSVAPTITSSNRQVFIIHGHDAEARLSVEKLVRSLDLEPIVLFERPNGGKTIIEKFEKESMVGFAIALLTADDLATCNRDGKEEVRARQNVVFELGYFVAKLGRGRVAVLKQANVSEPSDLHGIVYTEIDSRGAWKFELAKELKAAGFVIDMNKMV
jgi:predicted nucleotide-binding protein